MRLAVTNNAQKMRGPEPHLKRLGAPSRWMLDKFGGVFIILSARISVCLKMNLLVAHFHYLMTKLHKLNLIFQDPEQKSF